MSTLYPHRHVKYRFREGNGNILYWDYRSFGTNWDSSVQPSEVDESVIYNELAKLNVSKAADEIPAKIIKVCGQYILKPFTNVVILSL